MISERKNIAFATRPKSRLLKMIFSVVLIFCVGLMLTAVSGFWKHGRTWQADSERYVWGRIVQMEQGLDNDAGTLVSFSGSWETSLTYFLDNTYSDDYYFYQSSVGIQGTFFGFLNIALKCIVKSPQIRANVMWFFNTMLCYCCMFLLCWWVKSRMGWIAGFCAMGSTVLWWFRSTMSNLYWVSWSYIAPMVIVACFLRNGLTDSKKKRIVFFTLLGFMMFFRAGCGFEAISTAMLASEIPVVFSFLYAKGEEKKKYVQLAAVIGVVETCAFLCAVGVWFAKQMILFDGWSGAVYNTLLTISKRTGWFANLVDVPESVVDSIKKK